MTSLDPLIAEMRQIRKDKRITQAALAKRAGYSRVQVSYLETGKHSPSMRTVRDCLQAMGHKLKIVSVEE